MRSEEINTHDKKCVRRAKLTPHTTMGYPPGVYAKVNSERCCCLCLCMRITHMLDVLAAPGAPAANISKHVDNLLPRTKARTPRETYTSHSSRVVPRGVCKVKFRTPFVPLSVRADDMRVGHIWTCWQFWVSQLAVCPNMTTIIFTGQRNARRAILAPHTTPG